jgi:hypothetical protein
MIRLARAGLVLVGLGNAEVGVWGELSPRSFYTTFPGFGHHWVAVMGPYDEHLVRDYAGCEIGFAVLLVCMALWFANRQLVLAGGLAFIAGTVPHFVYHLTTTGSFSTADNVASLGSFVLEIVLVAVVMTTVARSPPGRVCCLSAAVALRPRSCGRARSAASARSTGAGGRGAGASAAHGGGGRTPARR